ncbi:unnamed protein product [Lathyrus oleraceus]
MKKKSSCRMKKNSLYRMIGDAFLLANVQG